MGRSFVIGDVHGCAATLRHLVDERLRASREDRLYLLGDLVDRGPDSKGVLDFLLELGSRGVPVLSVRGNHEDMLLNSSFDYRILDMWTSNGGLETLASFGADGPGDIPHRYREFLASLPYYLILEDFVIVHAGLNFAPPDPFSDTTAMLWTRSPSVDRTRLRGRRLICGHTPVTRTQLEASLRSDKLMLDNGCVFGNLPATGSLAALELGSMDVHYQECLDT